MLIDLEKEVSKYQIPVRVALHIGAHHGEEDDVYQRMGVEPIYVEANPEVFGQLVSRLPDRECHNVAISDTEGEVDLHLMSFDQSSSILAPRKHKEIYPEIRETGTIRVPCTTIDRLMEGHTTQVDLLNMDIQGAELLALKGARKTLQQASCVVTEINLAELYEGCGQFRELDRYLYSAGYYCMKVSRKYHRDWGDAFYVRECYLNSFQRVAAWLRSRYYANKR